MYIPGYELLLVINSLLLHVKCANLKKRIDKKTDRLIDRDGQTERQTEKQTDGQADKQPDNQTDEFQHKKSRASKKILQTLQ